MFDFPTEESDNKRVYWINRWGGLHQRVKFYFHRLSHMLQILQPKA